MWTLAEPTDEYKRRFTRFDKKKRRQSLATLANLDTLIKALIDGLKLEQVVTFGFVHTEPKGVLAVDQKGGAKLAETRLYIYPDKRTEIVHLLTLGDKRTQKGDIEFCSDYVESLLAKGVKANEPEKAL